MTDKEKLVELLSDLLTADPLRFGEILIKKVEERAKPKWISVKEALPEQDTLNFSVDVLICTNDGYVGVGCMCKYSHRESGWTWAGEDGVAVEGAVTHWMPLPPAPKGE